MLPLQDDSQLRVLSSADTAVTLREGSKIGVAIRLVSSAASLVFNFNPTIPAGFTAIWGLAWILSRTCAQHFESKAQEMIKSFTDRGEGKAL